ncbi:hypothetical protein [Bacillus sp. PBL-C9]|uniref:hypothetical protein n=1 Tax=Bacillus sp. PBL-C9 TaxID=3097548 RepID=UPI002A24880B|nr:hypothetical protein [Bacillus sp. PBL-C9]MDX9640290.1 hypothetical protein [Bacillus sp. PBL-C9]
MKRKILKRRYYFLICVLALFISTSFSPELVIRGNLLLRFHPIQTLIVDIDERGYDQQYDSYMYRVDGYSPHEWLNPEVLRGMYGNMWYLKKTDFGFYYVIKGGTTL